MREEKIKGYYRMENEIILELNKVAANNELFYNSIVQAAIGIVVLRRIHERGDLITPSAAHEKFVNDFHEEQKIVLRVLALGISMIPVVVYADKIAFYLHKFF